MAEKAIKSRIQLKNDTEANWNKAVNFVPRMGEIIIYNIDGSHDVQRIKIGNGKDNVISLPFLDKDLAAVATSGNYADLSGTDNVATKTDITQCVSKAELSSLVDEILKSYNFLRLETN